MKKSKRAIRLFKEGKERCMKSSRRTGKIISDFIFLSVSRCCFFVSWLGPNVTMCVFEGKYCICIFAFHII